MSLRPIDSGVRSWPYGRLAESTQTADRRRHGLARPYPLRVGRRCSRASASERAHARRPRQSGAKTGVMAHGDSADNAAMDTNIYAAAMVFLMAVVFSLYIMRRRTRLGRRTPKF